MFFRTVVQGIISKYATLTKADTHGAYQQEELQKDYAESARIQEASALQQEQEEESNEAPPPTSSNSNWTSSFLLSIYCNFSLLCFYGLRVI